MRRNKFTHCPIRGLAVIALAALVVLSLALTGCSSSSNNDREAVDDMKERFDLFVSAVTASDYSAQYELQVPPSKRRDCTEEFFVAAVKKSREANADAHNALVDLYENAEFVSSLASGTDRRTVIVKDKSSGDQFSADFRREEGQWYFHDPALEGIPSPLSECSPD